MSETDSKGYYVFYDLPKRTCTIEEAQSEGSITIDDVDRMYIYGDGSSTLTTLDPWREQDRAELLHGGDASRYRSRSSPRACDGDGGTPLVNVEFVSVAPNGYHDCNDDDGL
eukprot:CAMPEP_0194040566 /NCGR_PEP_ID=MMETSP0009_2-20130614/12533_1 /TAXON_ID=210454 /ORGANISM="Grammatophora oceanica, Strain CCMP 410" /LENGTH=111 /DNA_ID=CAMNT_0038683739 /DNA_START=420 /DNA_END=756 /DNA_ORIENTATION=+